MAVTWNIYFWYRPRTQTAYGTDFLGLPAERVNVIATCPSLMKKIKCYLNDTANG